MTRSQVYTCHQCGRRSASQDFISRHEPTCVERQLYDSVMRSATVPTEDSARTEIPGIDQSRWERIYGFNFGHQRIAGHTFIVAFLPGEDPTRDTSMCLQALSVNELGHQLEAWELGYRAGRAQAWTDLSR